MTGKKRKEVNNEIIDGGNKERKTGALGLSKNS